MRKNISTFREIKASSVYEKMDPFLAKKLNEMGISYRNVEIV